MEAPPPSYEDAIADDLAPSDGPRREYSGVTDENAPDMGGDIKGAPMPGGPPPPSFSGPSGSGGANGNGTGDRSGTV
jgi:hypothetical protein